MYHQIHTHTCALGTGFKLVTECSSLRDFGPYYVIIILGLFLYEDFSKMLFWLVLKLEISDKEL
jgi:hypothetical protein